MCGIVHHVVSHCSGGSSHTHQGVEGRHSLGKLSWSDLGGNVVAQTRSSCAQQSQLAIRGSILRTHVHESGCHTRSDSSHTHVDTHTRSVLGGQTRDTTDAAQCGPEGKHGSQRGRGEAGSHGSSRTSHGHGSREEVVVVELGRVIRTTEHIEHLLGDDGASRQIDCRQTHRRGSKPLGHCVRDDSASQLQHTTDNGHTIGHGHEGGVESVCDSLHAGVTHPARQGKSGHHGRVGDGGRQCQGTGGHGGSAHGTLSVHRLRIEHHLLCDSGLGGGHHRRGGRDIGLQSLAVNGDTDGTHRRILEIDLPLLGLLVLHA